MAERIGLQGEEAVNFIKEMRDTARAERAAEREEQRQEAERQRQHEIEMTNRHRNNSAEERREGTTGNTNKKVPKLPAFIDGTDDLDSYIQRFERFARVNNWNREDWAVSLSVLLTGKALDVYSRLSDEAATNYDQLKAALLRRYNLTEEGYRKKFRNCRPEENETAEQYIFRIKTYLEKWIENSNVDQTFEGLKEIIVKEQFIRSLP